MKNSQQRYLNLVSFFRAKTGETEARNLLRTARRRLYREQPLEYLVERLKIKRESIQWSLLREYRNHQWDGDIDPLLQVLDAVAHSKWVGVESATSVGKTYLGACLVFWFLENWQNARVILIAPKEAQLALHIWREMNLLFPYFNLGQMLTSELRLDPRPKVWSAEAFAAGVSAEEVEMSATRAQGFHAEHMLVICEETPGISEAVLTAFQNTSVAPHNIIVAFGNPDHQADALHQFCKLKRVKSIRISGFDHPNVVLKDPNFIPGAQSIIGLETMLDKYSGNREHPLYLSRSRGISPAQSKNSLIKWEWCERAARRNPANAMKGEKALGVDVANSEAGDEAAIAEGEGSWLKSIDEFPCPRADLLATNEIYPRMMKGNIDASLIGIDGVGVGASCVNKMLEMGQGIVDIQSGAKQIEIPDREMREQFNNLRSQGWWLLARDLERPDSHLILPYDKELFLDLCTPSWSTRSGKIIIEAKEDIKKRLGRSPNKGDAVMYWNLVRRGWMGVSSELTFARL